MDVQIQLATEEDLNKILILQKEAYLQEALIYANFNIPPLHQSLGSLKEEWEEGIVLKAVFANTIAGSVRAYLQNSTCHIGKLIVKTEFQNKGIGKRLLNEIEQRFVQAKQYELFTGHQSEKNLYLYRKLGYSDFAKEQIDESLTLIHLRKKNTK